MEGEIVGFVVGTVEVLGRTATVNLAGETVVDTEGETITDF